MTLSGKEKNIYEKIARVWLAPLVLVVCGAACSMFGGGSPTSVYKSFADAARKKDAAAMKQYLSADSLKDLKTAAQSSGKSEDEMLASVPETVYDYAELSNEKIDADGKTASLDVKNKAGETKPIYFVKDGSWKITSEKPKPKSEVVKESPGGSSNSSSSDSSSSTPAETGPVTVSASSLIDEAKSGGSGLDKKYGGRMMTVTDAELWEIQYSMLHIGAKYGSYSSGYIICSGSFSEYQPYASKISDLRTAGKSPGATIKGTFSKVVTDSGYTQVHLSPCVLSNLEKP